MKTITKISFLAIIVMALFSTFALAHGDEKKNLQPEMFTGLQTDAAKAVIAFKKALGSSDVKTARGLLAENVLIFEGKGVERSAEQYASHHMLSDMKYLKEMTVETIEHHVTEYGTVAVSMSRSTVKGTYKGKKIDRQGNESITLEKHNGEWKIVYIHWSN